MKKFFAFALATLLILSGIVFSTGCDLQDNTTWTFDELTGTLTISGTGHMKSYRSSAAPWSEYDIKHIQIQDGVISVGSSAFSDCTSVISVSLPASVKEIGSYAFFDCTALTTVSFSEGLTYIGNSSFYNCASLESVVLPEGLTTIEESAFGGCDSLQYISVPDSLKKLGCYAFPVSPGISNSFGYSLKYNTTSDGTLYLGNENNPYLILIKPSTETISCDVQKTTKFIYDQAFAGGENLTSVTISDSVISVGYLLFENNQSITTVTVPKSVKNIGEAAFRGCHNVRDIYFDGLKKEAKKVFAEADLPNSAIIHCTDGDMK